MGLIATAATAPPPVDPRRKCGVAEWIGTLDDADREALGDLITKAADPGSRWNFAKVHGVCENAGLTIRYNGFTQHAKNRCACADL